MSALRFDDRVAVITGAGRGLGRAYALLLAARGARVIVNDTGTSLVGSGEDVAPAQRVVDEIRAAGGEAVACAESVATPAGGEAIVEAALDHYGRVDVLVHNAGIVRGVPFGELTQPDLDHVLDVHLRGGFHVARPAFVRMCEAGYGRVVMTSSINGLYGNHRQANYSAAKAGLIGLSNVIALEGAERGVRSNVILPGAVTRMAEGRDTSAYPPMEPELVAPVVGWLAHESCSVTGEILISIAGRVARAYPAETRGVYRESWTVEAVADAIDDIRDRSDPLAFSVVPSGQADHIRHSFQMATRGEAQPDRSETLEEPVTIGAEAYVSEAYARAERDRLWGKVWQQAGRVEEIPQVGNFMTYEIMDESIVIVRTAPDSIRAHYNVCSHRGRRLVDTPPGARNALGKRKLFVCGFHGWRYDLEGRCVHVPEHGDWKCALTDDDTRLREVRVDTWGGWVWINLDPDCEPLREYLEPAASMLDPFELQHMRYRWRRWLVFDCNWKVALEAFNETYHVPYTHPELNRFGSFGGWARAQGKHSNIGYEAPKGMEEQRAKLRLGEGGDPRLSTREMQEYIWEHANTNTTESLVEAARRLVEELPEGTAPPDVLAHWHESARRADAARGVVWPTVPAEHVGESGTAWQIFPNFQIGHAVNNSLCYCARPYGYDPNKCIFEVAVYGLFPAGQEPRTAWELTPPDDPRWRSVLPQDFSNMAAVQQGMRSRGFVGTKPNPHRERSTANLHRNLARYMGTGAPRPIG